jgi:hypothetical protein
MKEETGTEYFLDVHEYEWSGTSGQPAGLFWIAGRSVIAAHASSAEERLLAQGAILIATLLFGRDPLESSHGGRTIDRITAARDLARLESLSGN